MPELISQTIAIGLSIAVVVSMAGILNMTREQTQSSLAQAMAENICYQIKLAAEQLSPSSQPSTARLALPSKIGNEIYSIRALNRTITVSSETASSSCTAGTPFELSGVASGNIQLSLSNDQITISGV